MMKTTLQLVNALSKGCFVAFLFGFAVNLTAQCANDKVPPAIYCVDLNTAFMPGACMVEIWAKDFIYKATNNPNGTGGDDKITFSFDAAGTQPNITITSLEGTVHSLDVFATDSCGNQSICVVKLDIDDNDGECPVACCIATEWTGWSVTTCTADSVNIIAGKFDDAVGIIYDVRQNSKAPKGDDWGNPFTPDATKVPSIKPVNWRLDSIGQIFGIAIDKRANVYLASSDVYARTYNSLPQVNKKCGEIYKASPPDFRAVPFASIEVMCQSLNGIGNIAYDEVNDQLFATSLEDGRIYRINMAGTIVETFDPFADNANAVGVKNGIVTREEQVWGVAVNDEPTGVKVYFPRTVTSGATFFKELWSVTLDNDGSFPAKDTEVREVTNIPGNSPRITDIAFSIRGDKMLISSRGTTNTDLAHDARTYSLERNAQGRWRLLTQYFVGAFIRDVTPDPIFTGKNGENSAGGVDFGFIEEDGIVNKFCEEYVWVTGNLMVAKQVEDNATLAQRDPSGFGFLYGIQGINYNGNNAYNAAVNPNSETDLFVDFDGKYTFGPKGNIGDVEIFKCVESVQGVGALIQGQLNVAGNAPIANVAVSLISDREKHESMSNDEGLYAFKNIDGQKRYMLQATNDKDLLDGVSTLDILLIQHHILGIKQLDDKAQLIAADIDRSGKISSSDLVELRRVILGKEVEFKNNDSWNFVSAKNLAEGSNPLSLDNYVMLEDFDSATTIDFVGVKTGDVNYSNSYIKNAKPRSLEDVQLEGEKAANQYVIRSTEMMSVHGFQFSLDLPQNVKLQSINTQFEGFNESNYAILDGELRISWSSNQTVDLASDNELIALTFDRTLSKEDGVQLSTGLTSEVYDESFEPHGIELIDANSRLIDAVFSFSPNPFSDGAIVNYTAQTAGRGSLTILNLNGQEMSKMYTQFSKGINIIRVNDLTKDLNQGIFLMRLDTDYGSEVIKIIKTK